MNEPKGVHIADYTYTNERFGIFEEPLELKTPRGSSNVTIVNKIKKGKPQADIFIIDIKNMNSFTLVEILNMIKDIMYKKVWIKTIIVIDNDVLLNVYSRI